MHSNYYLLDEWQFNSNSLSETFKRNMENIMQYKIGQRVLFIDENKSEVRGVIIGKRDEVDRLVLAIELDIGGRYYATVLKKLVSNKIH